MNELNDSFKEYLESFKSLSISDKRKEIIMNETKFLEFIDVNFTYPPVEEYDENGEVILQESKPVFDHFTAELPAGFVSLVGPNASGKSTLMMLASARICPSSGRINLLGIDTRDFFSII